ncbi:MAG: hypothetical protein ACTS42_01575 [Candidatus Hodgkinia cicadicola]
MRFEVRERKRFKPLQRNMLAIVGLGTMAYESAFAPLQRFISSNVAFAYPVIGIDYSVSRAIVTASDGSRVGHVPMFVAVEWRETLNAFGICLGFLAQRGVDVMLTCIGDARLLSSAWTLAEGFACYHKAVVVKNQSAASLLSERNAPNCLTLAATPAEGFDLCALAFLCKDGTLLLKLSAISVRALVSLSAKAQKPNAIVQVLGSCCEVIGGAPLELYFGVASFGR